MTTLEDRVTPVVMYGFQSGFFAQDGPDVFYTPPAVYQIDLQTGGTTLVYQPESSEREMILTVGVLPDGDILLAGYTYPTPRPDPITVRVDLDPATPETITRVPGYTLPPPALPAQSTPGYSLVAGSVVLDDDLGRFISYTPPAVYRIDPQTGAKTLVYQPQATEQDLYQWMTILPDGDLLLAGNTAPPGTSNFKATLVRVDLDPATPETVERFVYPSNVIQRFAAFSPVDISLTWDLTGTVGGTPSKVIQGTQFDAFVVLKNEGPGVAQDSVGFTYYLSTNNEALITSGDVPVVATPGDVAIDLAAGETRTVSKAVQVPDDLTPGIYYLKVFVDSGDAIQEVKEDNNVAVSSAIQVLEKPDIILNEEESLSWSPDGDGVIIRYSVKGELPAVGNAATIDILWGGTGDLACQVTVAGTPGDHEVTVRRAQFFSSRPAGSGFLVAIADRFNSVPEVSDENNSSALLPLTYIAPIVQFDLPTTVDAGHPITGFFVVMNPNPYPIDVTADLVIQGEYDSPGLPGGAKQFPTKRVNGEEQFAIPQHSLTWEWIPNYLQGKRPLEQAEWGAVVEILKLGADAISLDQWSTIASLIQSANSAVDLINAERAASEKLETVRSVEYTVKLSTAFGPDVSVSQNVDVEIPEDAVKLYRQYQELIVRIAKIQVADISPYIEQKATWVHKAFAAASKLLTLYELQVQAEATYLAALKLSGLSGNG